ncbi:MAG: shikimate kinase, partial [Clostridiales bacterium]|nr:shikimate kinase [Candidatus Crickella merdequi]
GRQISEAEIEAVTRKLESDNGNIVIIGMPGAGKTSVGRKLAELLDKEFIDADEYLQLQEGRTTVDIINTDGMESFRQLEIGYAGELMKNKGYVIAMGGGVVERVKNYDTIRENGYVIHLKRALEDLPTDGRPVSQKDGVQSIYNRRFKLYEKWSDVSINNTGIEETASKLARLFQ